MQGLVLVATLDMIAPELLSEAEAICNAIALQVEQEYGLRLDRGMDKGLVGITKTYEIEIQNHASVEGIKKRGIIWLYLDPKTKKTVIWTDKSCNFNNLEGNDAKKIEKVRKFTKSLVDEQWDVDQQLKFNLRIEKLTKAILKAMNLSV